MSIYICIGLADVVLWPYILGNRLGIFTLLLTVMDCLFRCQKIIFNLENNKCIWQGTIPRYWIYLLQNYFSGNVILKDKYKFEMYRKNSICIRFNKFAKFVNFEISLESLKLSKLDYYSLCGKLSLAVFEEQCLAQKIL